jgi:hypothetical protein
MDISIIPKWVWIVVALAVLGGVVGSGIYAVSSYNDMATRLASETSEKEQALEANKTLDAEVARLKQDVLDKTQVNKGIDEGNKQIAALMNGLSGDLDKAISERDEARRKLSLEKGGTNACKVEDAFATVPTERDIGLDYAWQVYCKTNPAASACKGVK